MLNWKKVSSTKMEALVRDTTIWLSVERQPSGEFLAESRLGELYITSNYYHLEEEAKRGAARDFAEWITRYTAQFIKEAI